MTNEQLLAEIARLEGEIASIQAQISQANALAACEMMVNDLRDETNARFDKLDTRLNEMRDATTGLLSSIETIVLNLFELHREDALTAAEYDGIELPAAGYDEQSIVALDYDLYGRLLLHAYEGPLLPITAGEYDALRLTAAAFEAYGLPCARYDMAGKTLLV